MTNEQILEFLPYSKPFLFVDGISEVSDDAISGHYTFRKDEYFYSGHFKNNPVTPGVILTETMAQIGLVCFGIYLIRDTLTLESLPHIALTSNQVDYYLPIKPGSKVTVKAQKDVFRFNKLRCKVQMMDESGNLICRGSISGMIITDKNEK